MIQLRYGSIITLMLLAMVGCGSAKQMANSRRSAQQAFDEGTASFVNKDYKLAKMNFDAALETPGLYPDLITEAYAKRAVCKAALGEIDEANADLDKIDQMASNQELVYAARSYVLSKQGKDKAARAAWAKARKINRAVKQFKD